MVKKKGITPVIAIVLLLMMTVAAAGMAWVFMQNMITKGQEQTEKQFDNLLTQKNLRVVQMEDVSTSSENKTMWIVQNPGDIQASLSAITALVKVNNKIDSNANVDGSCTTDNVPAQGNCNINITFGGMDLFTKNAFTNFPDSDTIKIIFDDGRELSYTCTPDGKTAGVC